MPSQKEKDCIFYLDFTSANKIYNYKQYFTSANALQ